VAAASRQHKTRSRNTVFQTKGDAKMTNITNQTESNRLSLNKETIADLEVPKEEQREIKGGTVLVQPTDPATIINPTINSARCSYRCNLEG
jgi:hypothetical protein